MELKFSDITPSFGVELSEDYQLTHFGDNEITWLKQLAAERGVVVVRDQAMDAQSQAEFGRRLGNLFKSPMSKKDVPEELIPISLVPNLRQSRVLVGIQMYPVKRSHQVFPC